MLTNYNVTVTEDFLIGTKSQRRLNTKYKLNPFDVVNSNICTVCELHCIDYVQNFSRRKLAWFSLFSLRLSRKNMSTSNGFVLILFPFHISFISDIAVMILKLRKFFLLGCFLSHKNDDFF